MKQFNLELLKGKKVAFNCRTKEQAQEFKEWYYKIEGANLDIYHDIVEEWDYYGSATCYNITSESDWFLGTKKEYRERDYKIISYEEALLKEEPKPKNNFKDYGFEGDFEGEILKIVNGRYIGYVIIENKVEPIMWNKRGYCNLIIKKYYLTPIKKEWYEDKNNLGKAIYVENPYWSGLCFFKHLHDNTITVIYPNGGECVYYVDECRPATKEEVLNLIVKE